MNRMGFVTILAAVFIGLFSVLAGFMSGTIFGVQKTLDRTQIPLLEYK